MLSHSNSLHLWKLSLASLLVLLYGAAARAAAVDIASLAFVPEGVSLRGGQHLYLEVVLNGTPTHKLVHITALKDGHLFASTASMRSIGLRIDGDAQVYDLDDVPGLNHRYESATQSLYLTAPVEMLSAPAEQLNAPSVQKLPTAPALPALLLNYNLHGTALSGGGRNLSALNELRLTGVSGVLDGSALSRYSNDATGRSGNTVRLDSSWRWSFRDQLTTFRIGDTITSALSWTRATRLGGLQLRREFSLQPELITFPIPAFRGQAVMPSTVELYVDGLRQYSGDVAPGAFQLNTAPMINGYGQAQIVVTDLLGRRTTLEFPFYTTGRLLKPGLSDWSVEAGYVRRNYTLTSFDYDHRLAGSGMFRYGLSPWLTVETHAEGASDLADGGAGVVLGIGTAGIFNAAFARSSGLGLDGKQYRLGYSWRDRWFSLALDHTQADAGYRDLGAFAAPPPARRSDNATLGFTLGGAGSLSASYLRFDQASGESSRYASAFYTLTIGRQTSVYASVTQNLDLGSDYIYQIGLSVSLGRSIYGAASLQRDHDDTSLQASVTKPVPGDGGYGWNLRGWESSSGDDNAEADLGWRGGWGDVNAGVLSASHSSQGFIDIAGAAALLGQGLFMSRTIDDAFALVSSAGIGGVPVLQENRPIGKTDAAGYYLLTRLNAYQRNHVSIDPMQLSGDLLLTHATQEVVPQDRAGVLVRFDIRRPQSAVVKLRDARGQALPLGSRVLISPGAAPAMVGYDGEVYLEDLQMHNQLSVLLPSGDTCQAAFDYRAEPGRIPRIGPLSCR